MFMLYQVELFYRKGLLPKAAFQMEGTSYFESTLKAAWCYSLSDGFTVKRMLIIKNTFF